MQGILNRLTEAYNWVLATVTLPQALIAAAVLLVLVIILLIVLSSKERSHEEEIEEIKKQHQEEKVALKKRQDEREKALNERESKLKVAEEARARADSMEADAAYEQAAQDEAPAKDETFAEPVETRQVDKEERQEVVESLAPVVSADAESKRILEAARAEAFKLMRKADQEYLEIVSRANDEAEFIRKKANERLLHAHDSLKQAIVRSGEIVEDAYSDMGRAALEAERMLPGAGESTEEARDA